ncbi:tryptophan 7-halogenase [Nucisporomicrobium flavum]|uniref:tryptophan 7-halogenase n=1 Tax=Nucisporomicrobium flavum TaxID=2785915 RepID=UPI0018F68233|nr:tryptophan 7-halogenase [Nucisporomicrobium flavum]
MFAAGAELSIAPAANGRPAMVIGLRCRRSLFERVLREAALARSGVTLVRGHIDDVLRSRGRAAGLRVDGRELPADLVVNASGRAERIRPWFDDHRAWDRDQVRQLAGGDVDLGRPLTSGHIVAAAEHDPSLMPVVGPYLSMTALPATLAQVEPAARAMYASGWRPPVPDSPGRDDLAELVRSTAAVTV